jgi:hypothetical protein
MKIKKDNKKVKQSLTKSKIFKKNDDKKTESMTPNLEDNIPKE